MEIMYNRENCCKPVEGKHMIDLETWARKEHYAHFASLDDPFFGGLYRMLQAGQK